MKLRNKVIAAVSIVGMLSGLAACGSASGATGQTTISYFSTWNGSMIKPVIEEFEKDNPNIKVDVSFAANPAQYAQTLRTRISGNQTPDVFMLASEIRDQMIDSGYTLDVTNEPFVKNLSDSNREYLTRKGKVYGASIGAWSNAMAYNPDLLAKVGYSEFPTTWDDFMTMLEKLKDAGITPYVTPVDQTPHEFQAMLGAHYAATGDKAGERKVFDGKSTFEKEYTPYLTKWNDLFDKGLVSRDMVGANGDDLFAMFTAGKVAVYKSGTWDLDRLKQSGVKFGLAPNPSVNGEGQYLSGNASQGIAIAATAKGAKLEAAKKLLTFLTSEKGLALLEKNTATVITAKNYKTDVIPEYKDLYDNYLMKGKYYLSVNNWPRGTDVLQAEMYAQVQRMVQGEITPAEVGKAMDEKLATVG